MALFEKLQEVYPKCRIQEDKNYASFSLGGAFVYELRIQKGSIRLLASNYPAKASFGECFKIIKQYKIEGKLINGHKLIFEAGLRNAAKLTLRIEIPFKEGDLSENQFVNSVINSCEKFHNVLLPLVSNFQKEPIGSLRELMSESKPMKKMEAESSTKSLQSQIAAEILKKYKDAVIKKIDSDNYLDIHLPSINEKRGTHLGINTAKNVIRMVFYCRDFDFVQKALANSSRLEEYSQGLRPLGDPSFKNVADAVAAIFGFLSEINTINSKGTNGGTQVLPKASAESNPKESPTYTFKKAVDAFLKGNLEYVAEYVQAGNPVLQFNGDTLITNELISYVSAFMEVDQRIADLVESGVDLDASFDNGEGYTAVHFAAWDGKDEILAYLLEAGAEADRIGEDGFTPLVLAAGGGIKAGVGHQSCVELLVERGADVNIRVKDNNIYFSKQGGTPLTISFINGYLETALYLIEQGADPLVLLEPCSLNAPSQNLFVNFLSLVKQGQISAPAEGQLSKILSLVGLDSDENLVEEDSVSEDTQETAVPLDLNEFLKELEGSAEEEAPTAEELSEEEEINLDEFIKKFVEKHGEDDIMDLLDSYLQKGQVVVVEISVLDLIKTLQINDYLGNFISIAGTVDHGDLMWSELSDLIGESEAAWVKEEFKEENPDSIVLLYCGGKYVYAFSNPISHNENFNAEDSGAGNAGLFDLNEAVKELEDSDTEETEAADSEDGLDLVSFLESLELDEAEDSDEEEDESEEESEVEDDEEAEEDDDELGYPMISWWGKDINQEQLDNYVYKWQTKSGVYGWVMGISGFIPDWYEDFISDKVCPAFDHQELVGIANRVLNEKIIPVLKYAPEELFYHVKSVWWIVPFCIWKEDTASFVFIDKNGFYALFKNKEGEVAINFIFPWDKVASLEFETAYAADPNVNRLTLFQDNGGFLTFDEFVGLGEDGKERGSFLSVVESIWEARRDTILASSGVPMWYEGKGGEGFKEFENSQDLLEVSKWKDPFRPNPSMFGG
jgi:hypothetical protein